jgi:hypothetical protein
MSASRILYLNAHGLNERKYEYIISLLDSNVLDIVAIAETWQPAFLLSKTTSFHAASSTSTRHSRMRGHPDGGVSIFIRPEEQSLFDYHASLDTVSVCRGAHIMTFAYYPPSLSDSDLDLLLQGLPKSTLLMADFNTDFRTSSTRRTVFTEHMQKCSLVQIQPSNGVSRLDHCFAHPSLRISCEMHHQYLLEIETDHPALVVECSLPEALPILPDVRSYNLSLLRRPKSREGTKRYLLQLYRGLSGNISRQLQWIIAQANEIDDDDDDDDDVRLGLAECAVRALEEAVIGISDAVFEQKVSASSAPGQRSTLNLECATDIISSYQRTMRSQLHSRTLIVASDRAFSAEEECANVWERVWNKDPELIRTAPAPLYDSNSALEEIDVDKVRAVVSRYPSTKAPGEDGIHILVLKALLAGPFAHHLTSVFNLLLQLQVTPSHWNQAIVCMLPKDTSGSPSKCRPLSLTSMFRRLFEKVLHPTLISATASQIHPSQSGFTQSNSTLHPLQLSDHSHRGYRVLYDAMYAFDSPLLHILSEELSTMGVHKGLHRCIHYLFFCNLTSTMVANGRKSRKISRSRGLFQGTVLSPPLFNIYINRLLINFSAKFGSHMSMVLVVILAYADDLKVFARSYEEACSMTQYIADECSTIGLTIRPSKCAVLSTEVRSITIRQGGYDEEIHHKPTDKYLGVDVDQYGINWRVYYSRSLRTYKTSLRWLALLTLSWPPGARCTVYTVFVHPQLEYCAALFALVSLDTKDIKPRIIAYHDVWQQLEASYEEATCKILGQKRFTKGHYSILGWPTLPERFLQILATTSLAQNHLQIPSIAVAEDYIRNRIMISDDKYETIKHFLQRKRIEHFDSSTAGNRERIIPRTRNGRDIILENVYDSETQHHLIYWRKGIFALGRICICEERFTLSHAERCFGTHAQMETMIREGDYSNVTYYINAMWTAMNSTEP